MKKINMNEYAQELELIDRIVISIFLSAEKKCGRPCNKVYSEDIHKKYNS